MPEIDIDMYIYIDIHIYIYIKYIGVSSGVASVCVEIADEKLTSYSSFFSYKTRFLPKHIFKKFDYSLESL